MKILQGRFIIKGTVQGVGFRYYTLYKAKGIGITGFVRNLYDGSVEVVAEGTKEQLELTILFLEEGPRFARVESVNKVYSDIKRREYNSFEIL